MKTWLQLVADGWIREGGDGSEVIYKRPSGKKVRRKRDLTESETKEFGDLLFPGKRKKTQVEEGHPQPVVISAPEHNDKRSDVFEADEVEAPLSLSNEVLILCYIVQRPCYPNRAHA